MPRVKSDSVAVDEYIRNSRGVTRATTVAGGSEDIHCLADREVLASMTFPCAEDQTNMKYRRRHTIRWHLDHQLSSRQALAKGEDERLLKAGLKRKLCTMLDQLRRPYVLTVFPPTSKSHCNGSFHCTAS